MIPDPVLDAAVSRGLISPEQALGLRYLAWDFAQGRLAFDARTPPREPQDDEKLRFITGFADIFVTLGLALFLGALTYFAALSLPLWASWGLIAVVSWALAEFFTRRRRMALPSIVLLAVFALTTFVAAARLLGAGLPSDAGAATPLGEWLSLDENQPGLLAVAALVCVGCVTLHYLRFRVPVTVAAGAAALSGAFVGLVGAVAPQFTVDNLRLLALICGLVVFAVGMRYDLSDPARATRRTDIAFWLHLLAAPLIVHSAISWILGDLNQPSVPQAVAVLCIFALLAVIAVVIDRRAVLVSGLVYAGFAFGALLQRTGLSGQILPATLLLLGAFILLLSAGWRPLRTGLLRLLPAHLATRLPHPLRPA